MKWAEMNDTEFGFFLVLGFVCSGECQQRVFLKVIMNGVKKKHSALAMVKNKNGPDCVAQFRIDALVVI